MEFRKLQRLVELELSNCSELGCFFYSIVDLSQLKKFDCRGVANWKICNEVQETSKLGGSTKRKLGFCNQPICD